MLTDLLFVLDQFVLQGLLGICGSGRCVADAGFNGSSDCLLINCRPPPTMVLCRSRQIPQAFVVIAGVKKNHALAC